MSSRRGVLALILTVVAVVAFAVLALGGWKAIQDPKGIALEARDRFLDNPANPSDSSKHSFVVHEGESAARIADRLQTEGLIEDARSFRWMADLQGLASDLSAGEYELSPSMRPSEILAALAEGKTKANPLVTFPEGWRAEEIAERLAARGIGTSDQFMTVVKQGQSSNPVLRDRPPGSSLEGYLFPESYAVDEKTTPDSMTERMVAQFDESFTPEMRRKAAALGMTVHQVVILASVIEREAVIPSERPLMAGVFYNRLKAGMPLQSDPTVQYAVATADPESHVKYGWWKKDLTEADLQIDSPYNTYMYPGLPAGPICDPGLASLMAAVGPTQTDYYYFVARPDGSHAFAKTLEEHNANVLQYRR